MRKLRKLVKKLGIEIDDEELLKIYTWFVLRFNKVPTEKNNWDFGYFIEWLERWNNGIFIRCMDEKSKEIWDKVSAWWA